MAGTETQGGDGKKRRRRIRWDRSAITFENLVASGQDLDLILMWNGNVGGYKDLAIFDDVAALAKQTRFDLYRFDAKTMNTIKEL